MIEIEGEKYKTTGTVPYQQIGMIAKFVETPDGNRIAVKRGGKWSWWTAKDRLQAPSQYIGMSTEKDKQCLKTK